MEHWKPVPLPAYAPLYEVSTTGRIRRTGAATCRAFVLDDLGYPQVRLYNAGKGITVKVHRMVAEAFLGPRRPGLQVNHKDGNKTNAALENLEFVTQSANIRHAYTILKRQTTRGSRHAMARLTEADIPLICSMRAEGRSPRLIGQHFGVSSDTIRLILKGKLWRHVTRPQVEYPLIAVGHKGTSHGMAKLHEKDIALIRQLKADGMTYKELAAHFQMNRTHLCDIVKGRAWKHLP